MIQNNKSETITVQLGDENQIEVDVAWLATHSKMVQAMMNQSGMKKVTSIQLISIPNLIHWSYFQATIFGQCDWIWDLSDAELDPVWFSIIQTLDYLDVELQTIPHKNSSEIKHEIRYHIWLELLAPYIQVTNPEEYHYLSDQQWLKSDKVPHPDITKYNVCKIQDLICVPEKPMKSTDYTGQRCYYDLLISLKYVRHHLVFLRLMLDTVTPDSIYMPEYMTLHIFLKPELRNQLFELAPDMNIWDQQWPPGMILAGGAMATVLTERDVNQMGPSEDLDFWVYGSDAEERRSNFRQAFDFLTADILPSTKHYYVVQGSSVTILRSSADGPRHPIQLVYTNCQTPKQIIARFDCAHVKTYYDGHQQILGYSDQAEVFYQTRMINYTLDTTRNHRLLKLLRYNPIFSPSTIQKLGRHFDLENDHSRASIPSYVPSSDSSLEVEHDLQFKPQFDPDTNPKSAQQLIVEQLRTQLQNDNLVRNKVHKYWEFPENISPEREMYLLRTLFNSDHVTTDKELIMEYVDYDTTIMIGYRAKKPGKVNISPGTDTILMYGNQERHKNVRNIVDRLNQEINNNKFNFKYRPHKPWHIP